MAITIVSYFAYAALYLSLNLIVLGRLKVLIYVCFMMISRKSQLLSNLVSANPDSNCVVPPCSSSILHAQPFRSIVSPRVNDLPIANKFSIKLHSFAHSSAQSSFRLCRNRPEILYDSAQRPCMDFITNVYYVNDSFGEVLIRRLDDSHWPLKLFITIQILSDPEYAKNISESTNDLLEYVPINPSNTSFMRVQFRTENIKLYPLKSLNRHYEIPKIIVQTYYTTNPINSNHWDAYHTFVELNPEYKIILMLDRECRDFIRSYFRAEVLEAYDSLIAKAFRADLFRYAYLYINGGCYFDNKMISRIPLRDLLDPTDEFIVCSDALPGGSMADSLTATTKLYNAIICSRPLDNRMKAVIEYVVGRIKSRQVNSIFPFMSGGDLSLTGPVAFLEALKRTDSLREGNVRFKHGLTPRDKQHPRRDYIDYFVIDKRTGDIAFTKTFKGYYSGSRVQQYGTLWNEGQVFYDGPVIWHHIKVYAASGTFKQYFFSFPSRVTVPRSSSGGSVPKASNGNGSDPITSADSSTNNGSLAIVRIPGSKNALLSHKRESAHATDPGAAKKRTKNRDISVGLSLGDLPNGRRQRRLQPARLSNDGNHVIVSLKVVNDRTSDEVFTTVALPLQGQAVTWMHLMDQFPVLRNEVGG